MVDELQMKYAVINQNIQDLGLDYGDAVAKYDSEFDQSIKMIELVRGIKKDQLDEQQRQELMLKPIYSYM